MSRRGRGIATAWERAGEGRGFQRLPPKAPRECAHPPPRVARAASGNRPRKIFGTPPSNPMPHRVPSRRRSPRRRSPGRRSPGRRSSPRRRVPVHTNYRAGDPQWIPYSESYSPLTMSDHEPFSCKVNEHTFHIWNVMEQGLIYRSRSAVYHTRKFKDMPLEPLEMEDEESFKKRCTAIADYVHQRLNNSSTFLLQECTDTHVAALLEKKPCVVKRYEDMAIVSLGDIDVVQTTWQPPQETELMTILYVQGVVGGVDIFNVHVRVRNFEDHTKRTDAFQELIDSVIRTNPTRPILFAGDFNTFLGPLTGVTVFRGGKSNGYERESSKSGASFLRSPRPVRLSASQDTVDFALLVSPGGGRSPRGLCS